jgi:two-component system, cell cycle response regulator DivK
MAATLILIIEDDPSSRKLVRDVLQVKGYQTIETETAEEGIGLAKEKHPALILMDIQLPRMSGIEALRHLRADPDTQAIPVIAVTASVMTQQQTNVLEAGFDAFERKPISVAALLKKIEALVASGRAAT